MKKILSLLLALAMIATLAPFAMAEETSTETETVSLVEKYTNEVGNKWSWRSEPSENRASYKAWLVNSATSAPTQQENTQSTKLSSAHVSVLKFPMPKPGAGQKIGKYILQLSVSSADVHAVDVLKLPGENYDVASFRNNTSPIAEICADYTNRSALEKNDDGTYVDIPYEDSPIGSGVKRYFLDITTYVNDLYNAGQRDHFYVLYGIKNTQVNVVVNTTWGAYITADVDPASYHSFAPADPLEMQSATIEDGMEGLTTEKEISFVFNNGIDSATIILNGETAKRTVKGATVTLDTKLETFKNYTLELSVTDIYGTSETYTYEFVTGGGFSSAKLSDGFTYHITASADPVAMTSKKNIDGRSSHAAVYRIPIPRIPQGEALDTFVVTIFPFSQNASGAYKLPGDDWELTTDLNEDGAMLRYADLYPAYLNSGNAVCTASEKVTVDMTPELTKNKVFRHTYDMTRYANECIANGEQYLDFAVYAPGSTMDVWGFSVESWNTKYKATYEYTTYPTEGSREYTVAKFVPADSEAAYDDIADATAISKSAAYKAVAKVSNATAHDFDVVIAIADYEDDTLVSVKLTTVTVPARTRDFDVVSAAIDVSDVSDEAKAFVWSESDNYPFALHSAVSIS